MQQIIDIIDSIVYIIFEIKAQFSRAFLTNLLCKNLLQACLISEQEFSNLVWTETRRKMIERNKKD
jgi:hypothetical protein